MGHEEMPWGTRRCYGARGDATRHEDVVDMRRAHGAPRRAVGHKEAAGTGKWRRARGGGGHRGARAHAVGHEDVATRRKCCGARG